jgi:DNA-binding NtrC family response regulator
MLSPGVVPKESMEPTALLVSPCVEDHEILREMFHRHGWMLEHASSFDSISMRLSQMAASVVITERDLSGRNWKDVMELLENLPDPPFLIVISRQADESLWAEALNLGAYDVLSKPLDDTEALRVLTSAWNHRQEAAVLPAGHWG